MVDFISERKSPNIASILKKLEFDHGVLSNSIFENKKKMKSLQEIGKPHKEFSVYANSMIILEFCRKQTKTCII
jgi:hypothetical protein